MVALARLHAGRRRVPGTASAASTTCVSRPDVDPERIAVTGISGGGAATFWIAAADERVKVAVPVSGMADLESYVANRVINGHCDCMFLYNTFQWPWTRIAGPDRPAADAVRQQRQRRASSRWTPTTGSSTGWSGSTASTARATGSTRGQRRRPRLPQGHPPGGVPLPQHAPEGRSAGRHRQRSRPGRERAARKTPIRSRREKLRVFPTDADLPKDAAEHDDRRALRAAWPRSTCPRSRQVRGVAEAAARAELRRVTFQHFPERIPQPRRREGHGANRSHQIPDRETEVCGPFGQFKDPE